ncbi:hypothetical protein [Rhodoligotrophos defluvii]|nr:hypothetical protein [Rhodoligotrophos defluvii]
MVKVAAAAGAGLLALVVFSDGEPSMSAMVTALAFTGYVASLAWMIRR